MNMGRLYIYIAPTIIYARVDFYTVIEYGRSAPHASDHQHMTPDLLTARRGDPMTPLSAHPIYRLSNLPK